MWTVAQEVFTVPRCASSALPGLFRGPRWFDCPKLRWQFSPAPVAENCAALAPDFFFFFFLYCFVLTDFFAFCSFALFSLSSSPVSIHPGTVLLLFHLWSTVPAESH